jgi:hypothetical protein
LLLEDKWEMILSTEFERTYTSDWMSAAPII